MLHDYKLIIDCQLHWPFVTNYKFAQHECECGFECECVNKYVAIYEAI